MSAINLQKASDNTLSSTSDYEQLFDHVAAHFQAQGGTLKTIERAQGRIEAAWKYGVNPFGMRITAHFTSEGDDTIQITLNGSFVDAIDTFGAAKKKARAITDELLKPIDVAAWPIKEVAAPTQQPPVATIPGTPPQAQLNGADAVPHRGKRKGLTAVLIFLGGGFGLHKFYTGNWGWGLLYLVLCTTGIPLALSVIEFIRVLCLTPEEFDRRYNYRRVSAFSWVW
jgi:TM2 domain-containing membrane protein YozV